MCSCVLKLKENYNSQCKTKEGRYCTLAEKLFHHKTHCLPGSDQRSRFSPELEAIKKLRKVQRIWLSGPGYIRGGDIHQA